MSARDLKNLSMEYFHYHYRKLSEILITLGSWVTEIILQNNYGEIWTILDLLLIAISQSLDNLLCLVSIFLKIDHPQPIKILIVEKCPKLPRIYSI